MQIRAYLLWIFLLLAAVFGLPGRTSYAQSGDPPPDGHRYFPRYGQFVSGDFLTAYQSVTNPELVFGDPITGEFQESTRGKIVQYFERARMEKLPDGPDDQLVTVSLLGHLLYEREKGQPLELPANFPACLFVRETGFEVCYAFRDFFEAYGGVSQFGYPISNFILLNQRIVQYFQKARFEWHTELPPGQKVVLAPIGIEYFNVIGEDQARRLPEPIPERDLLNTVVTLRLNTFVERAVLPQSGQQTIYIILEDQRHFPLKADKLTMVVKLPDGTLIPADLTNQLNSHDAYTYQFEYPWQPVGIAEIFVSASLGNLKANTVTSFRIWW
jgi:hypothetical protein